MFWLSYECFSILCDAFLLKSVISSHKSCDHSAEFSLGLYITNTNNKRILKNAKNKKIKNKKCRQKDKAKKKLTLTVKWMT